MGTARGQRNRGYVIVTAAMLGIAAPGCAHDEVVEVPATAQTSGGAQVVVVAQPVQPVQPQPVQVVAAPTYAPVQTQPVYVQPTGGRMGGEGSRMGYAQPPPAPAGRMGGMRM